MSLEGIDGDAVKKEFWENQQDTLKATKTIKDFSGANFDAVMMVGGFGVMYDFFPNADLGDLAMSCWEAKMSRKGVVGAGAYLIFPGLHLCTIATLSSTCRRIRMNGVDIPCPCVS